MQRTVVRGCGFATHAWRAVIGLQPRLDDAAPASRSSFSRRVPAHLVGHTSAKTAGQEDREAITLANARRMWKLLGARNLEVEQLRGRDGLRSSSPGGMPALS